MQDDQVNIGASDNVEIAFTGVTSLLGPDPAVRWRVHSSDQLDIAVTGGLALPTYGLRLMQGTVLPSDQHIPWVLIPSAGLVASNSSGPLKWSVGALTRVGLALSETPEEAQVFTQTDLPWLDPMLSPITDGYSAAVLASIVWDPSPSYSLGLYTRAQYGGGLDFNARTLAWRHLNQRHSLGAGVVMSNEQFGFGRDTRFAPRFGWKCSF